MDSRESFTALAVGAGIYVAKEVGQQVLKETVNWVVAAYQSRAQSRTAPRGNVPDFQRKRSQRDIVNAFNYDIIPSVNSGQWSLGWYVVQLAKMKTYLDIKESREHALEVMRRMLEGEKEVNLMLQQHGQSNVRNCFDFIVAKIKQHVDGQNYPARITVLFDSLEEKLDAYKKGTDFYFSLIHGKRKEHADRINGTLFSYLEGSRNKSAKELLVGLLIGFQECAEVSSAAAALFAPLIIELTDIIYDLNQDLSLLESLLTYLDGNSALIAPITAFIQNLSRPVELTETMCLYLQLPMVKVHEPLLIRDEEKIKIDERPSAENENENEKEKKENIESAHKQDESIKASEALPPIDDESIGAKESTCCIEENKKSDEIPQSYGFYAMLTRARIAFFEAADQYTSVVYPTGPDFPESETRLDRGK